LAGEQQAVFLKEKGDALLRGGDVHGAIGAYSAAVALDARSVACVANRAAAYLRLADATEPSATQAQVCCCVRLYVCVCVCAFVVGMLVWRLRCVLC
jgi:hypothetical protein